VPLAATAENHPTDIDAAMQRHLLRNL